MKIIACIYTLSLVFFLIGCQGDKANIKNEETSYNSNPMEGKYIFTGTYTKEEGHVDGKANGIEVYKLNDNDSLELAFITTEVVNPSYLALSSDGKYLYTVNETGPDVSDEASISSFLINRKKGKLELINEVSSHSFAPCYIGVDSQNRMAFAVNYVGGVVVVFPIKENGGLEKASQVIKLEGKGSHIRQDGSHPHSIILSPDEQFAYVADLGTDKIMIYKIDYDSYQLIPADVPFVSVEIASGPRHMAFHPSGKFLYLINELNSMISLFEQNSDSGDLRLLQSVSTLPDDFSGISLCADIHITDDGKYLYGTNRGHNSLAIFAFNEETGSLSLMGHESTRGDYPRNFVIDDNLLYVANQNSDNIVVFRIQTDGSLLFLSDNVAKTPVCLKVIDYTL